MKDVIKNYQAKPLGEKNRYAVCLPLIWENEQWHILYEIRSQHISQPGEVSFPGGRVEDNETYRQAAVRETTEELNVDASQIDIWGEIDYLVQSNRSIHCFVGELKVDDWRQIEANEEVDRLFTVPLNQLIEQSPVYYDLTAEPIKTSNFPFDRIRNGDRYAFSNHRHSIPFYENLDETIWGMTAQFTSRFTDIIRAASNQSGAN
ncbi:NUDIX hydrolase [Streptococcus phocae subsp. salmonis]|uniref:NUDIX hydrolase n=1 Tax=Streptococcus phocae TaxID=119224 RepID=UPI0005320C11|nr:CoA pyrophosphatase [Streptococcus phocae]KGR73265.1 DNA mismatch repair protein MutT [Streptococcus phocae subsp. salmonis]